MVSCVVKDWQGTSAGAAELELAVAKETTASHILHRAVVRQLANARQGTVSTKTRAEVSGGGRKPWKQKGTGRARAGSNRSPLWRGGGVIFGPKPRDYSQKMNRKERRLALRTALMSRSEALIVVQDFAEQLPRPKTKELINALTRWGVETGSKVLLITAERQENIYLSARNVPRLKLIAADQLNVFDLLHADSIVATSEAIAKIQEVYGE
ncbi:50S ribosomal protein L4 [Synechococcus sp. PCC 6312]|uniref:50S ribosomal protein L4 n=1 Tax=Synechococcus sp. (strain ATCC 27167 / PCC 6312) TaxID=195253 RepID=UPI00029F2B0C|nr:50S ribosomal protein L4 [Synechococcus sp. PCC 6312]AFY62238.1 LSU ribosomal protein L4P [Synechococcus sp. PCC 6312]